MVTAWQAVQLYAVCSCTGEWGVYILVSMLYASAADITVADQHYSHVVSPYVCCLWSANTVYSLHHTECISHRRRARQACQNQ